MKAVIRVEANRDGKREILDIPYDTDAPKTIWIETRSLEGDDGKSHRGNTYRLVVGAKGGLTLK